MSDVKAISLKKVYDALGDNVVWSRVYTAYFNAIPCVMKLVDISISRALPFLTKLLSERSVYVQKHDMYHVKTGIKREETAFVLNDGLIVVATFERQQIDIYYSSNEDGALAILEACKGFANIRDGKEMFIVVRDFGLNLQSLRLNTIPFSLNDNYNDDLIPVHEVIKTSLEEEDRSGLILLHGIPGTGKSTYIRHLAIESSKKVIFCLQGWRAISTIRN
jgi:predicted alpha/beta-fold hydrolase